MAEKEEAFVVSGTVTQALANTRFRVQLDTGTEVLAHVAGKMRKNFIRIVPGDKVNVEAADNDDSAHLSRSLSALIGREVRPAMVLHRACLEKADSNAQLSFPTKSGINEEKSQ